MITIKQIALYLFFEDIDPMIKKAIPETNLHAVCAMDKEEIAVAYSREFVDDSGADFAWELPDTGWGAFSIF